MGSLLCAKNVRSQGFTLMELMITIAIVGILASIAIPSYTTYLDKAHYAELVEMSKPNRTAVTVCYQTNRTLSVCNAGQNGIPANLLNSSETLARYIFTINGTIFVFPNNRHGFTLVGDHYTLQPSVANGTVRWRYSGPGVTKGYINAY